MILIFTKVTFDEFCISEMLSHSGHVLILYIGLYNHRSTRMYHTSFSQAWLGFWLWMRLLFAWLRISLYFFLISAFVLVALPIAFILKNIVIYKLHCSFIKTQHIVNVYSHWLNQSMRSSEMPCSTECHNLADFTNFTC